MEQITLTIFDIDQLNSIQKNLLNQRPLNSKEQTYLCQFLAQIPFSEKSTFDKFPFEESIEINIQNTGILETSLKQWKRLFNNIPGYDYVSCWTVEDGDKILLNKNVIMTVCFAPSLTYNASHLDGYYIHLKDDGTSKFWFPTFEDAEKYPELYNFKGTWKEAYYLLIETLKKGWPMEEFPEELKPFLKK